METQGTSKPALENKKSAKRIRMIEEAYNLFVSKGVHATAIDEVVKKAGVAKGTFYLYFHDKYDLLDQIVLYKSTVLVRAALRELGEKYQTEQPELEEGILFFASRLIDSLEKNHDLVLLIHKKLSASLSVMEYLRDGELSPDSRLCDRAPDAAGQVTRTGRADALHHHRNDRLRLQRRYFVPKALQAF